MFWGLKLRSYLNVRHNVNVVGVTGIDISGTRAISAEELENYLTENGVKLDMDSMWFGNEIRCGNRDERIVDLSVFIGKVDDLRRRSLPSMGTGRALHSYWDLYNTEGEDNAAGYGFAGASVNFAADQKNFQDFAWNHPVLGIKANVYDYEEIG